jgi:hypothetical protein
MGVSSDDKLHDRLGLHWGSSSSWCDRVAPPEFTSRGNPLSAKGNTEREGFEPSWRVRPGIRGRLAKLLETLHVRLADIHRALHQ